MRKQAIETALLSLIIAAFAAGCGHKKISECNALVQVINAGITGLEKAPKNEGDPTGVSDLQAMAESMDKVANDAKAVPLTLPEIKKLSADYQKMARDIAKAERDLADAAKAKDAPRRAAAEAALEAAVKQEDPLVDNINKFCQKP